MKIESNYINCLLFILLFMKTLNKIKEGKNKYKQYN